MEEGGKHINRTNKNPITKNGSPSIFRKMIIQNYSRPEEESSESDSDACDDVHENTINAFIESYDGNLTRPAISDETQNSPRFYRRFENDGKLSNPSSLKVSHSSEEKNGDTENTNLLSKETGNLN